MTTPQKMTLQRWIPILKSRKFYKTADLMRLSGLSCRSCRVNLSRLVRKGFLIRLGKELFGSAFVPFSPEEAICRAYLPSYISCESALSRHGLIDQMPYVYTALTTQRGKKTRVGGAEVQYVHLRKKLFWGYQPEGEAFVAEPEKALLDWLCLKKNRKTGVSLDEIHREELDIEKLKAYCRKFPKEVQRLVKKLFTRENARML